MPFFTTAIVLLTAWDWPGDDSSSFALFSGTAWWFVTFIWASTTGATVLITAFIIWMSTDNGSGKTTFPVASGSVWNRTVVAFTSNLAILLLTRVFGAASTAGAGHFTVEASRWSFLGTEWFVFDVEVTLLAVFAFLVETFVRPAKDLVDPNVIVWFWNTLEHTLIAFSASAFEFWTTALFKLSRAIIVVDLAGSTSPAVFDLLAFFSVAFLTSVVDKPWAFSLVASTFLVFAAEDTADNWSWSVDNSLVLVLTASAVWIVFVANIESKISALLLDAVLDIATAVNFHTEIDLVRSAFFIFSLPLSESAFLGEIITDSIAVVVDTFADFTSDWKLKVIDLLVPFTVSNGLFVAVSVFAVFTFNFGALSF